MNEQHRYIQLSIDMIVEGITYTSGTIDAPGVVLYPEELGEVELGDIYDPETGTVFTPPLMETPMMAFSQAQAVMSARAMGVALPLTQEAEAQTVVAIAAGIAPAEKASAEWTAGEYVGVGTVRTYGGTGYSCIQPHVTQAGWTPDAVPALWTPVREDAADWTQPVGAHDAYKVGDVVTYGGKRWVSTADANVWAPGTYGWEVVPE